MQLQQVERVCLQIPKTALNKRRDVLSIVTTGDMWIEATTGFCGDIERLRTFSTKLCQQTFAASITVNIRGVEEINAIVQSTMKCRQRLLIID